MSLEKPEKETKKSNQISDEEWDGNFDEYHVSFKREKISAENQQYIEDRSVTQEVSDTTDASFGARISEYDGNIKHWRNFLKSKHYNGVPDKDIIERIIKREQSVLDRDLSHIRSFLQKIFTESPSERQITFQNLYLSTISESDPLSEIFGKLTKSKGYSISEHIQSLIKGYKNSFIQECAEYISRNPNSLNDELLIQMSYERKRIFQKNEIYLVENKEIFENEFIEKLKIFKKKNSLDINIEDITNDLRNTNISCVDPLVGKLDDKGGQYEINKHLISIDYSSSEDAIKHIYNHEALHAVSGTTILKEEAKVNTKVREVTSEDYYEDYFPIRIGLRFSKPHDIAGGTFGRKDREFKSTFRWLNEAVTEDINVQLTENDSNIYPNEREIFKFLVDNSNGKIEKVDFYHAYFENYNGSGDQKIPHWKSLFSKIQNAYDPTFIQRLDMIIKEKGIKKVMNFLKSNDWPSLTLESIK